MKFIKTDMAKVCAVIGGIMLKKISLFFYAVPTPLAGLALGIASLGLGLENSLSLQSYMQIATAFVSAMLIFLVLAKYVLHPVLFVKDISHPVLGSILPTLAMSIMLQSKTVNMFYPFFAEKMWFFGVGLHLFLFGSFLMCRMLDFKLSQMVPSWFVPFVGFGIAAVTIPNSAYYSFAYWLMILGLINYAFLLPIMYYRLIFLKEIENAFKPTIAILAAPASLILYAYLNLEPNPSLLLAALLFGIAVLMTVIVYFSFFHLLRLPFSPAFAAYTFPMAVGAGALMKAAERLAEYPLLLEYGRQIRILANVELAIATAVVVFVCLGYVQYYARAWYAMLAAKRLANKKCLDRECLECFSNC